MILKITPLKILIQVQSWRPPKGNSLHKTSYDVKIVKIGPPLFYTAHSFIQTPKSCA